MQSRQVHQQPLTAPPPRSLLPLRTLAKADRVLVGPGVEAPVLGAPGIPCLPAPGALIWPVLEPFHLARICRPGPELWRAEVRPVCPGHGCAHLSGCTRQVDAGARPSRGGSPGAGRGGLPEGDVSEQGTSLAARWQHGRMLWRLPFIPVDCWGPSVASVWASGVPDHGSVRAEGVGAALTLKARERWLLAPDASLPGSIAQTWGTSSGSLSSQTWGLRVRSLALLPREDRVAGRASSPQCPHRTVSSGISLPPCIEFQSCPQWPGRAPLEWLQTPQASAGRPLLFCTSPKPLVGALLQDPSPTQLH